MIEQASLNSVLDLLIFFQFRVYEFLILNHCAKKIIIRKWYGHSSTNTKIKNIYSKCIRCWNEMPLPKCKIVINLNTDDTSDMFYFYSG